ncbi:S9 family peptidase [Streptomyces griseoincarnatus]
MSSVDAAHGRWVPELLHTQVAIGQVAVHSRPPGGLVVFTRRSVVAGRDRIGLWSLPWSGGSATPLTDGPWCDTHPRFSPDGGTIAFLRDGRLHLMDLAEGEPRQYGHFAREVRDLDWFPDGAGIAVLTEDERAPAERYASPPPGGTASPTCRVLDRGGWRLDGEGLLLHPRHVHRVGLDGTVRRLSEGPLSLARPRVGPRGEVYVMADRGEDSDLRPCPQVQLLTADGLVPVTALAGGVVRHHVRDDGTLTVIGRGDSERADRNPPQAFHVDPATRRVTSLLPGCADHWVGALSGESDLHDWWTEPDDSAEVTGVAHAGGVRPYDLVTGRALGGPGTVVGSIARHGGLTAAVLVPPGAIAAPEVYALEADSTARRLSTAGSSWIDSSVPPTVEQVEAPGPAGPVTVHLLHPPGTDPSADLPTVISLHGGPTAQWGPLPNLEALLLAGAGYRVALPNPRGSTDRGSAWVAGLHGQWGRADAEDVHAVVDHLVATGRATPGRLGVCGLSYGGFLTHWLTATSDRFAAAVSENGVSNQISVWANCDIGPSYGAASGMGDPLDDAGAARLWEASPLRLASRIRTPLLMLQAEDDLRCPAADNEQLFLALRALGRTVRYVLYPESSHLYQGTGRFDRRLDRHQRLLDWFRAHLPLEHV